MIINAETKISALLRENPDALEAIIEISSKFSKLRNPVLRKIMAARTTIDAASKIGACSVDDFFKKLRPLGFTIDNSHIEKTVEEAPMSIPAFMKNRNSTVEELDVRPVIDSGNDPYAIIMKKVKQLPGGSILKLINGFEPLPLIKILSKKGFEYHVEHVNADVVNTYFCKTVNSALIEQTQAKTSPDVNWDAMLNRHEDRMITIDVRNLEMPLPMLTILEQLDKLPDGYALYVHHKQIPVFLLPELQEKGFEYRTKELSPGQVDLLIYRMC